MIWGFTGTSKGCTGLQASQLLTELMGAATYCTDDNIYFHHGDCVGADLLAARTAEMVGWITVAHPGMIAKYRANHASNIILPPEPFLVRDHRIVDSVEKMIATPHNFYPVARSGTWATIRYALKKETPVLAIFPDGSKRWL